MIYLVSADSLPECHISVAIRHDDPVAVLMNPETGETRSIPVHQTGEMLDLHVPESPWGIPDSVLVLTTSGPR